MGCCENHTLNIVAIDSSSPHKYNSFAFIMPPTPPTPRRTSIVALVDRPKMTDVILVHPKHRSFADWHEESSHAANFTFFHVIEEYSFAYFCAITDPMERHRVCQEAMKACLDRGVRRFLCQDETTREWMQLSPRRVVRSIRRYFQEFWMPQRSNQEEWKPVVVDGYSERMEANLENAHVHCGYS